MIIMASASGTLVPAIARLVAADEDTVRDGIHTFNAKGLAALDPRWAGPQAAGLLRWRNAHARHPGVLAAQHRERARLRSECQQRWGRPKPKAA